MNGVQQISSGTYNINLESGKNPPFAHKRYTEYLKKKK